MQFLKENKILFILLLLILPLFLFHFDKLTIESVRNLHENDLVISRLLELIDPVVNFIGYGLTLILSGLLLYIVGKFIDKKLYECGKVLFISLISAGIVVQIIKHIIGRARPRLTDNLVLIGPSIKSGYDSFPSGHTTLAFCFAYILSRYYPRYRSLFYGFAVLIGFERIEDTAHFPSDVLVGMVVGMLVGKAVSAFILKSSTPLHLHPGSEGHIGRQGPF
ncbi:MAG: phosphatase PAP2 family protein [Dissulfurimicrobium sp.]|uniref:phosphatase PAP2 family protein n=1 Tax=Dissulfurimicrobium TaxID=1769732 RepID=UPI001EDB543D|nr:phosphatase PAP2 family protein [Dissulfurimicrobium hydrothermale]UKL13121.1 phosphatase PAP2 family protein [Dissulfurimicrobium hydrothermale]